jgi:hypothetical protein
VHSESLTDGELNMKQVGRKLLGSHKQKFSFLWCLRTQEDACPVQSSPVLAQLKQGLRLHSASSSISKYMNDVSVLTIGLLFLSLGSFHAKPCLSYLRCNDNYS